MDEHEMVRRVSALPDQFASRLDESTNRGLRSMNGGGEWDELMDLLVAALIDNSAAVTAAERQELETLLEAMHMPTEQVRQLTVTTRLEPDTPIRTTVDVPSLFADRTIPSGTEGLVLEANPSGTYLVDVTLRAATETEDGDFDQATLAESQFEVITAD